MTQDDTLLEPDDYNDDELGKDEVLKLKKKLSDKRALKKLMHIYGENIGFFCAKDEKKPKTSKWKYNLKHQRPDDLRDGV